MFFEEKNKDEIDKIRKEWSIPFEKPGDETFVYDSSIIKKSKKMIEKRTKNTNPSIWWLI